MHCRPKLVIFGPQRCLPDPDALSRLRLVIVSEPKLVAAIRGLPTLWRALVQSLPQLHRVPGQGLLEELKAWIEHSRPLSHSQPFPNVLLTPLTIIVDLANYLHALRIPFNGTDNSHAAVLESVRRYGGFQGLCTGILAAIAVACSEEEHDIGDFGAVAVRLAVCVGAIVDLDGAFADPPDEACCLSVRSRSGEDLRMPEVLQDFPDVSLQLKSISARSDPRAD